MRNKWLYYTEYIKFVGDKSTVFTENKQEAIEKHEIEKEQEKKILEDKVKSHTHKGRWSHLPLSPGKKESLRCIN